LDHIKSALDSLVEKGKIKNEDLFDDIPCVVDYINRKAEQKRNMEKRKNNLVNAISDDNWGEPVSMENDFSIEEILDMPTEGEVQMNLPLENADCKVQMNLTNIDCEGQNDLHKNESHGAELHSELFCVTGNDSGLIDIEALLY